MSLRDLYQFKKVRVINMNRVLCWWRKGYVIYLHQKGKNLLLKVKNEFANKEIHFEIGLLKILGC